MATNTFLSFASGSSANVESDTQYAADLASGGSLATGFVQGLAKSAQVNKVARQSSLMAAALGQIIADVTGNSASDSLTVAQLEAYLLQAMTRRTRTVQFTTAGLIAAQTVPSGVYEVEYDGIGCGGNGGVGSLSGSIPAAGGPGASGERRRGKIPCKPGDVIGGTIGSVGQMTTITLNGTVIVSIGFGNAGGNASGSTPGSPGTAVAGSFASGYTGEVYPSATGANPIFATTDSSGIYRVNVQGTASWGTYGPAIGNSLNSSPGPNGIFGGGGGGGVGLTSNNQTGQPGGTGGTGMLVFSGIGV